MTENPAAAARWEGVTPHPAAHYPVPGGTDLTHHARNLARHPAPPPVPLQEETVSLILAGYIEAEDFGAVRRMLSAVRNETTSFKADPWRLAEWIAARAMPGEASATALAELGGPQ